MSRSPLWSDCFVWHYCGTNENISVGQKLLEQSRESHEPASQSVSPVQLYRVKTSTSPPALRQAEYGLQSSQTHASQYF